ncbi:MAG: alpha/beta hydrolase [Arthrobacter sp.]
MTAEQELSDSWDEEHRVPILVHSSPMGTWPLPGSSTHIVFPPNPGKRLNLRVLFEPEDSRVLIVSLHGALKRSKYSLPRFEWRGTLSRLVADKLYLSDSTLELSRALEIGWYLGTHQQDLTSQYAGVVAEFIKYGNYSKVLFVGSSAGGFGALALSRYFPGSIAVVFSPQTAIANYHARHRDALLKSSLRKFSDFRLVEESMPDRVSMRDAYGRGDHRNFVRYVQNAGDAFHFDEHYAPFARQFDVDPANGGFSADGRFEFLTEWQNDGHAPPSRGRFVTHIAESYENFTGESLVQRSADHGRESELGSR